VVTVSGPGRPQGWFAGGFVTVASGQEAGARRGIVRHGVESGAAVLALRSPLPALAAGDALQLTPGCDKSFPTCRDKFDNVARFRGFPHLPGNDRAFAYARSGS
jgi:uncharacterized phage protein (TIGR02218 family)